jgi:phytoene synthase
MTSWLRPRRSSIAETDLGLVRLYWPVDLRPAFDALFGIYDALADVVASSTQPELGAIRLAWWREALQRLDHHPPPAEPRLQAAARDLLPRGISGAVLAEMEAGYAGLLEREGDHRGVEGEALFAIGAALLGADDAMLPLAGRIHAVAAAARRGLAPFPEENPSGALAGHRFARALRPLTALARLAARDLRQAPAIEPEATPGRAVALLSHRLFGTVA